MSRRAVTWLALVAGLAIAIVVAAVWWVPSSQTALIWALEEAGKRLPGKLKFEGVAGSLRGGIDIRRVTYETPELNVALDGVKLRASQAALVHGRIAIDKLEAARLTVRTVESDKAREPPQSLALPIEITISQASILQVEFNDEKLRDLSFAYAGGSAGQALSSFKVDSDFGRMDGQLRIAGSQPFVLSGTAALVHPKNYEARFDLSGNLLQLVLAANGQARGGQARATAHIAPFARNPLESITAHAERLDLAQFGAAWPATKIDLDVIGSAAPNGWPVGTIEAVNTDSGTVTAKRLPLQKLTAIYSIEDNTRLVLSNLRADLGIGGTLSGSARLSRGRSDVELDVRSLDLKALHTPLRMTRLDGKVSAEIAGAQQHLQVNVGERGMRFAVDATRRGDLIALNQFSVAAGQGEARGAGQVSLEDPKRYSATATLKRLDPSLFGNYPQASFNGGLRVAGTLAPDWSADATLVIAQSLYRGVKLSGDAAAQLSPRGAQNVKVALIAGANTLRATGNYGRPQDALVFSLDARRLGELDPGIAGALSANGRLMGTIEAPDVDLSIAGSALKWKTLPSIGTLRAHAAGGYAHHAATIEAKGQDFDFSTRAEGSWDRQRGWTGVIGSFENTGTYPAKLLTPMTLAYGQGHLTAGPAEAAIAGGRISLTALSWQNGRLDTRGRLSSVPVAPLLALAGTPAPQTDLRVGGAWSLGSTPRLNGTITLTRETGDVVLPGQTPIALQVEQLQLDANVVNDAVNVALKIQSASINGRVEAAAASFAREAPLKLNGKLEFASLRLLDPLIGTRVLLRGRASVVVNGSGTLGAPRFTGNIAAAGLGIEAPQYGIRLHDGTLAAELTDTTLVLRELAMLGDQGGLKLLTPVTITYGHDHLTAGPAEVAIAGGRISLTALSWQNGRLDTRGRFTGVPVAPLLALAGTPAPQTDLRLRADWSLNSTPRLNGTITLMRETGDVVLPGQTPVALQIEQLRLDAKVVNDAVNVALEIQSTSINGRVEAAAASVTREAPLKLNGKLDIGSLRVLDALIGTQALVRGRASVVIAGSGTLGAPQFTGTMAATGLGIEAPQYGVRLHDGTLAAELTNTTLILRDLVIMGDQGRLTANGTMSRTPSGGARLAWRAEHLRLLNRPDMQLQVDGNGTAALAEKKLVLRGSLKADQAYFEFDKPGAPKLSDDVVVLGRARPASAAAARVPLRTDALDLDVLLDSGERLHIVGAGLDTDLVGRVRVQTNKQGVLEAHGVLASARGIYYTFGQRLEIERGRLIFDGPPDNPALDIVAKRRNLAVEAGVIVTGTVRVPSVTLTSDPPVPDSEKLAWLILGHGLQEASAADLVLLQGAASALVGGGNSLPLTQRIARKVGLDELTLRGTGEAGGQAAALGKRLSDKLYLEYQQGLAAGGTVLRLSYALSRTLSLRVETGTTSGVGFFFTRSYE